MPKKQLTEKDVEFLEAIVKNSDSKLTEIAKKANLPIGSVYRIYNKLINMGIIKGRIYVLDYSALNLNVAAYLIITPKSGHDQLFQFIENCEQIEFIGMSTDKKTIIAFGYFSDKNELNDFIKQIKKSFSIRDIKVFHLDRKYIIHRQAYPRKKLIFKFPFSIFPR